ncbi:TolC family protein [Suttonella sp. R2A3]|uniref:TolC family protein n=1 Tax=Suttonella sp. R2A3 TaxID=2908648 RepID=UPI001F423FA4|nr:TolC family protein [Suttonella sp. R2A3]UJF25345.1 TolC family protein [Suttonella sp. R2A3]
MGNAKQHGFGVTLFNGQSWKIACLGVGLIVASWAQGRTLPEILQDGLANDPGLAEARANERIADSRLAQSEAQWWPTLGAKARQPIANSRDSSNSFKPVLEAKWTVYDFGRRAAQIERDTLKTDYYAYKTEEAAEELIYELSGFYLEALRAKLSLDVAQGNLQRHRDIVNKLKVIVSYDPGRRSELTQAEGRLLQVEDSIMNYNRTLGLVLLRLSRYVQPAVSENELNDPFTKNSVEALISQYNTSEEDLATHPSFIAQKKELDSIEAELRVAERDRWPKLNLVGQASDDDSSIYLNMDVDVFNRATAPGIEEKEGQIIAARARLDDILRNLSERGQLAELKMREDQSRIDIADSQIRALKQVTRDYEDQFSIAQRSLLDVVNAYSELAGIEQLKVQATYDLMLAKLDYLSSVGALRIWAGIDENAVSRSGGQVVSLAGQAEGASVDKRADDIEMVEVKRSMMALSEAKSNRSDDAQFVEATLPVEPEFSADYAVSVPELVIIPVEKQQDELAAQTALAAQPEPTFVDGFQWAEATMTPIAWNSAATEKARDVVEAEPELIPEPIVEATREEAPIMAKTETIKLESHAAEVALVKPESQATSGDADDNNSRTEPSTGKVESKASADVELVAAKPATSAVTSDSGKSVQRPQVKPEPVTVASAPAPSTASVAAKTPTESVTTTSAVRTQRTLPKPSNNAIGSIFLKGDDRIPTGPKPSAPKPAQQVKTQASQLPTQPVRANAAAVVNSPDVREATISADASQSYVQTNEQGELILVAQPAAL